MTHDRNHPPFDSSAVHSARRYAYWLGGKDHFAADRASGDEIAKLFPGIVTAARENHRFCQRAVRHLAEHGIDQLLDVGTGLPTDHHPHHIAQQVNPATRVVYVDNDPLVLCHARALLTGDPLGRTAYLDADLRHPEKILASTEVAGTLDLTRPVGLLIVAVLHFIDDDAEAYACVKTLIDALAPGSMVVLSHASHDLLDEQTTARFAAAGASSTSGFTGRTREQFAAFLSGTDLVEPGITVVSRWHRDPEDPSPPDDQVSVYGAVACT